MQSRATQITQKAGDTAPPVRRRGLRHRVRSRLRGDYDEDGVFRPVRLSPWVDLGIAGSIVVGAFGACAGFFVWLAHTQ